MESSTRKPYDYFHAMERLKESAREMGAEERNRLKAIVAVNASDPEAVALYVDLAGDDWAHIYPPAAKPEPITTGKAIDKFLNTYGKPNAAEDELLERLIFNPVPEYSDVLAGQGGDEPTRNMSEMAKEINSAPSQPETSTAVPNPVQSKNENSTQKPSQNAPLTLELAKIFVKQAQFERAHEIISKIILNNPEKSVYFADQLRFLEKLIKIQNAKNKK